MKLHLRHFVFLFLTFTPYIIEAQVLKSMAVKMGVSRANQNWDVIDPKRRTEDLYGGFCAAELEFLRGKTFRFSSEFSYCQKGYQALIPNTNANQPDGTGAYRRLKFKIDYMSFCPQLTARHQGNRLSPYIGFGPRIDYLFSYRVDGVKTSTTHIRSTAFGFNLFAGLEYQLNDVGLFIEGKYMHDLTYVFEAKNRAYILSLGVRINLSDK